jgi:hypothetical protein
MARRHTKHTKDTKKSRFVAFVRLVDLRVVKPSARVDHVQFMGISCCGVNAVRE